MASAAAQELSEEERVILKFPLTKREHPTTARQ